MIRKHILLLDNFDSFTYNLVDELRNLDFHLQVFRNTIDAEFLAEQLLRQADESLLMLSPGPGAPAQAGNMMQLLSLVAGKVPVLGICLGHQAIVQHYGGEIVRAPKVVHGKTSLIEHQEDFGFEGLANPFPVARYHSLIAGSMPECLTVTAAVEGDSKSLPMAVLHPQERMMGLQFHPESIMTSHGSLLLQQCIKYLS
ncbi:MAG: aminodeoxychorismate/anthranilate synthase component II [Aestuariibacter sp.]